MTKNTSVTLSPAFQDYIDRKIDTGLYNTASEVIREGLRRMKAEDDNWDKFAAELEESSNSEPVDFDPKTYFKNFRSEYLKKKALQTKSPRKKTA